MRACIPTAGDSGLEAGLHGHFGSAPFFTLANDDGSDLTVIVNANDHQSHGTCSPLSRLADQQFDCMIVAGMGRRAVEALNRSGRRVFRAAGPTVAANLEALKAGTLQEMTAQQGCAGHDHDH